MYCPICGNNAIQVAHGNEPKELSVTCSGDLSMDWYDGFVVRYDCTVDTNHKFYINKDLIDQREKE